MIRRQLVTTVMAFILTLAPLQVEAGGMEGSGMGPDAVVAGGVVIGAAVVLFVVTGLVVAATENGASETHGTCVSRCEKQSHTCRNRTLWHLFNAERVRKLCEPAKRECRRKCEAARRKSTPAPSPAPGPSIRPASAPTTKPAMQPSTPPAAVDEPGLHVSLAPFVAPSPSGDTRYGLAVVGRF